MLVPKLVKNLLLGGQLKTATGAMLLLLYGILLAFLAWLVSGALLAFMFKTGVGSTLVIHFANSYDFLPDLGWFDYAQSFLGRRGVAFDVFLGGGVYEVDVFLSSGSRNDFRHIISAHSVLVAGLVNTSFYLANWPVDFQNFRSLEMLSDVGNLVYHAVFVLGLGQAFKAGGFINKAGFKSTDFTQFIKEVSVLQEGPELFKFFEQLLPLLVAVYLAAARYIAAGPTGAPEDSEAIAWLFNQHGPQLKEIWIENVRYADRIVYELLGK